MLTTSIIFTLLVALWGHPRATALARRRHVNPCRTEASGDRTPAGPSSSAPADDH
jgi:hypothetical protein